MKKNGKGMVKVEVGVTEQEEVRQFDGLERS